MCKTNDTTGLTCTSIYLDMVTTCLLTKKSLKVDFDWVDKDVESNDSQVSLNVDDNGDGWLIDIFRYFISKYFWVLIVNINSINNIR